MPLKPHIPHPRGPVTLFNPNRDDLDPDELFFYDHGHGYSWNPRTETEDEGRVRCAEQLAVAEARARAEGISFEWMLDSEATSAEFSDETPPYYLWQCFAFGEDGVHVGTVGAVDLGRDGTPRNTTDRRIIEAELAADVIGN